MGVTLDLRMIDHRHVVERGLPAVNKALAANDASLLVDYLCSIPFTPNEQHIVQCRARLERLRELNAPDMFVVNEERFLQIATGEAYQREALRTKPLDELREMLGMWCFLQNSFSVGTAWVELDWYLQPAAGPKIAPTMPLRPKRGDPAQTVLDYALQGAENSPLDSSGMQIIRNCGSRHDDCFGYNPPAIVRQIVAALERVDPKSWNDLVEKRTDLVRQMTPSLLVRDATIIVSQELADAKAAFAVLQTAYQTAAERDFGVACEYSL